MSDEKRRYAVFLLEKPYLELKNEGGIILRDLQEGNCDFEGSHRWEQKCNEYLVLWLETPFDLRREACPDQADRSFYFQAILLRTSIRRLRELSMKKEPKADAVITDELDIVDKILEERGKVHGNSNWSGAFFSEGVELLRDIGEKSDISRHSAFDGHMYAGMQCFIRLMHNPYHRDSYDDLLGYLRLAMKALEGKHED